MVRKIGYADTVQFCWLSWFECNKPTEFSFDVVNRVRRYLYRYASRISKETEFQECKKYNLPDNSAGKYVSMIIDFYENHTATETIKFFNLPDTRDIRKTLSLCLPKPERVSGKKFGERRKKLYTTLSYKELIKKGLSKATASRAAKRGYYYSL